MAKKTQNKKKDSAADLFIQRKITKIPDRVIQTRRSSKHEPTDEC